MTDPNWNRRRSRDDMHFTPSMEGHHEGRIRHSRYSWWQISMMAEHASIKDDCRPSLDASSSYSTASRPNTAIDAPMPLPLKLITPKPMLKSIITHIRADSSDSNDLDSPTHPINIDDWPTPPTSGISPTPNSAFMYSQLSWKTPSSKDVLSTPTKNVAAKQPPQNMQAQPVQPTEPPRTPPSRPQIEKPDIPEKSSARKPANVGLLGHIDHSEDPLLQCHLDQLRSEVRTLRHKSSFLQETLKQTIHHRTALHAEREAINPSLSCSHLLLFTPDARVIDRGRPVSRSGYAPTSDSGFWEARAPSSLGMVSETISPSPSPRAAKSPSIQTVQKRATAEVLKLPPTPPARMRPALSFLPSLVAVPKTRPSHSSPSGTALRKSVSLPRVPPVPARARSPLRAMSDATALQSGRNSRLEVVEGGRLTSSRFGKIIGLWRSVGKIG